MRFCRQLSKIMRASTVYRAPGGLLPQSFWVEDETSGTIGGVELAFMSATLDRDVALEYAHRGTAGVLLEIRQVKSPSFRQNPHLGKIPII